MKKLLLILSLIIVSCSVKKEFRNQKKVSVLEITKDSTFTKPKNILFVFTGHTHLIYFYKDLAKKLKTDFKKENIKVDFNYNLSAKKSFQIDLDNTPKKKYNYINYDALCSLNINYPYVTNGFSTKNIYDLNFSLKNSKTISEEIKGVLRIKHRETILSPSKLTSKKLVELITE